MLKTASIRRKLRKMAFFGALFSLLFIGSSHSPDYFEISKNLDIFNALYRELNISYVDGTQPGKLMKTGIDAMLGSLDPYTNYFSENDIEDYRFSTTGEYAGIGAQVIDIDGKIIITDPFEGFSAHKAGLRAGDQIVEVNGINVNGKKSDNVGQLLKGTPGTRVNLKVIKAGKTEAETVSLNREEIKIKSVPYSGMLQSGNTGYIRLASFYSQNCSQAVKESLAELKNKGCRRLVLDLRGNPGGLLQEAVDIVNLFVERDIEVVNTRGKLPEWEKPYKTVFSPADLEIPLVVLVDENSASASEIVSGALQDLDRAVIAGKRTFGKGLVQQTKPLVYNSSVKITVAKYYIPSGRCVQALDYSHRDAEGRVEKVPDSLITAFKTRGGRIVYDGAGIMPDVNTEDEKAGEVIASLVRDFHIFNYATLYWLKHKEIAPATSFALSDEEYNEFMSYLREKNFTYKTWAETELEEFKKGAEDNRNFDDIKNEYAALLNKIKESKKEALLKDKAGIKRLLEQEIVGRYYFEKGRIEYDLKHDKDIEAVEKIFSEQGKVKEILSRIDKPQHPFNPQKKF